MWPKITHNASSTLTPWRTSKFLSTGLGSVNRIFQLVNKLNECTILSHLFGRIGESDFSFIGISFLLDKDVLLLKAVPSESSSNDEANICT